MTKVQKRTNQNHSPPSKFPAGPDENLSRVMILCLTGLHQSGFHGEDFLWFAADAGCSPVAP